MVKLGLFATTLAEVRDGNVFDTLCHQLAKQLSFKPGERDLVMLQHKFVVEWADGTKVRQRHRLRLMACPTPQTRSDVSAARS